MDEGDFLMLEDFNRSWHREKSRMVEIIIKNKTFALEQSIWKEKKIYTYIGIQTLEAFNELWPEALHERALWGPYHHLPASKSFSSVEGEETTEEIPPLYNFSEENFCKELYFMFIAEQQIDLSPWRVLKFFEGSVQSQTQLAKLEVLKKIIIEAGIDRELDLNMKDQPAFLGRFIEVNCSSYLIFYD